MNDRIHGGSGSFAVPFDEERSVKFRPAPEAPDVPVRAGITEQEGRAMLDQQVAVPLPEGISLPMTINMRPDADRSVQLGSAIVGPGEELVIDADIWRQLGSAGPGVIELVRDHDLQRSRFGEILLREGPGQPVTYAPGSVPWRREKAAQFAAVDNLRPGPERDARRAELEAHFAAPDQQVRDTSGDVASTILGHRFQ